MIFVLFIIGFTILIKGADFLVKGASYLAKKFNVSELMIGMTIVAFGTSTPELSVNLFASFSGNSAIAIGNIIGSNIFNILFILGISAIIFPLAVVRNTVTKGIPLGLLAAVLLGILTNDKLIDGSSSSLLSLIDGLVMISFFIIFLYYSLETAKCGENAASDKPEKEYSSIHIFILIIIGLLFLFLGGKWVIDGAVQLATLLGVNQSLIGLTIVGAGTSLPELATSAVAVWNKNVDIAVGNVVGSNIFNIFFILGLSSIIRPILIPGDINLDILILIFINILLFLTMFTGKKRRLDRWEGVLFVIIYIGYLVLLILK
jgi:cation:H+ antiporter